MKNAVKMTDRSKLKRIVVAVGLGALLLAPLASPASAQPDRGRRGDMRGEMRGGHDRDWRAHETHARGYWQHPYYNPHVIYAPPTVYAPPPMQESPGLNLVFPLNFR